MLLLGLLYFGSLFSVGLTSEGCSYDEDAPIFHQQEDTSSPIRWTGQNIEYFYNNIVYRNWDFLITYSMVVENTVGWPNYNWMPDGHISTVQVPVNNIATA